MSYSLFSVFLNFEIEITLYLRGPLHFNVSPVPCRSSGLGDYGLDNLDLANKHIYIIFHIETSYFPIVREGFP